MFGFLRIVFERNIQWNGEQETLLSPNASECQRKADGRKRCGDKSLTA